MWSDRSRPSSVQSHITTTSLSQNRSPIWRTLSLGPRSILWTEADSCRGGQFSICQVRSRSEVRRECVRPRISGPTTVRLVPIADYTIIFRNTIGKWVEKLFFSLSLPRSRRSVSNDRMGRDGKIVVTSLWDFGKKLHGTRERGGETTRRKMFQRRQGKRGRSSGKKHERAKSQRGRRGTDGFSRSWRRRAKKKKKHRGFYFTPLFSLLFSFKWNTSFCPCTKYEFMPMLARHG